MKSSSSDAVVRHVDASGQPVRDGDLRVSERDADGIRVIAAAGDLDLATAPSLCLPLDVARRAPDPRVVVDLGELTFCDSTGLRALILAGQEITASAGAFAIVLPPGDGAVTRMFSVCGAAELLRVFSSVEQALDALAHSRTG